MASLISEVGNRYGRLTVIARAPQNCGTFAVWKCSCDCGAVCSVVGHNLRRNMTRSCGCLKRDVLAAQNFRHGHATAAGLSREYKIWAGMRGRCSAPGNVAWARYGGAGIKVCSQWDDFNVFLRDMGPCPPGFSIERKDNRGDYEPANCRWASRGEQGNNRSNNVIVEYLGQRFTVAQLAKKLRLQYLPLYGRIKRGMAVERAVSRSQG